MNAVVEVGTASVTMTGGTTLYVISVVTTSRALSYAVPTFATNPIKRLRHMTSVAPNTIFDGSIAVG